MFMPILICNIRRELDGLFMFMPILIFNIGRELDGLFSASIFAFLKRAFNATAHSLMNNTTFIDSCKARLSVQ